MYLAMLNICHPVVNCRFSRPVISVCKPEQGGIVIFRFEKNSIKSYHLIRYELKVFYPIIHVQTQLGIFLYNLIYSDSLFCATTFWRWWASQHVGNLFIMLNVTLKEIDLICNSIGLDIFISSWIMWTKENQHQYIEVLNYALIIHWVKQYHI
jgi:hypothetical protein